MLMPSIGLSSQSESSGPVATTGSPIDVIVLDDPIDPIALVLTVQRGDVDEEAWRLASEL